MIIYIYTHNYTHISKQFPTPRITLVWPENPNRFQILSCCSSCLRKLALVLLPPIHRTQPGTCVPGISPPCLVMKNGGGQIPSAWWKSSAKFSSFRSCLAKMLWTNMEIWATVKKVDTKQQGFSAFWLIAFIHLAFISHLHFTKALAHLRTDAVRSFSTLPTSQSQWHWKPSEQGWLHPYGDG